MSAFKILIRNQMMKLIKPLAYLFLLLIAFSSLAAPTNRTVTIQSFHPQSLDRAHCTNCSGLTRIYVNSAEWGDSTCRQDAADLAFEDSHIMSILLAAWLSKKEIKIEVNSEERPLDTVCRITAAWAQ